MIAVHFMIDLIKRDKC
jgi:hypothetical protein